MSGTASLAEFELPNRLVEPTLRALRLNNTFLDTLFYDTDLLALSLFQRGEVITTQTARVEQATVRHIHLNTIDLSALSNPEGCILVVDAAKVPYVTRFDSVGDFIAWATTEGQDVSTVTITGVGSSALGAVAFAWNASAALGQRVAAIVPGYGVADAMNQALGGWFGFGVGEWAGELTQKLLAYTHPAVAHVGRHLLETSPRHAKAATGAPVFVTGSAASDVLHDLLRDLPTIRNLIGHSKGALAIGNALRSLIPSETERLRVTTFGCPIDEVVKVERYTQFLGSLDVLGWLNSWGNKPDRMILSHHSTNTFIPCSMAITSLLRFALGDAVALPAPKPA